MATTFKPKNRNVIPRWRDFVTTLELGELSRASTARPQTNLATDLNELEIDWQREKTLSFAADLISGAVISGGSAVAREAAQHVLDLGRDVIGEPLALLASSVLQRGGIERSQSTILQTYDQEQLKKLVGAHRRRLAISPRDAISWVDLSLLYVVQGLAEKAKRAMLVALGLEPDNRYVLRSAARLFIHRGQPDIAHRLLRRSETIQTDPWIMSAELATATSAKFIPFSIDRALKLLVRDDLDPGDTTELSAAVATMELSAGSAGKAKKHLRSGLRSPNENSLAQVQWLQLDLRGFLPNLNVSDLNVQRSFEASVWQAHAKREWEAAAAYAIRWFKDQPFSSRPALISANITASLLEDYNLSIKLSNQGLVANPNENALYSLLAFAHASKGETHEAREALAQIKGTLTIKNEVTSIANHGLIAFREGQPDIGRRFYEEAYQHAISAAEDGLAAGALTYWAREEILAKSPQVAQTLSRAREAVTALGDKGEEASAVLEKIEGKLEKAQ